ncbi:hypothetical protein FAGKG844_80032 [Frankia sp. AgKG'84/4]
MRACGRAGVRAGAAAGSADTRMARAWQRAISGGVGQHLIVTVAVASAGGSFATSILRTSPSSTMPLASSVSWRTRYLWWTRYRPVVVDFTGAHAVVSDRPDASHTASSWPSRWPMPKSLSWARYSVPPPIG